VHFLSSGKAAPAKTDFFNRIGHKRTFKVHLSRVMMLRTTSSHVVHFSPIRLPGLHIFEWLARKRVALSG
jgi:hypothetical protein